MEGYSARDVVIVVPRYKRKLGLFESISVQRLLEVLHDYDIYFVMPNKLVPDDDVFYRNNGIRYERFDDSFFENKASYTRLCLSTEFYNRFAGYKYMLIHQTDAFLFSDCVMEFANMNYDYVGAPISTGLWQEYHVGNGGLSLRKIASCVRMLEMKEEIYQQAGTEKSLFFDSYEDYFWGFCGYSPALEFEVPDVETAAFFSLQDDSLDVYRKVLSKGLPFGIHEFPYNNLTLWRPIIKQISGIDLPVLLSKEDAMVAWGLTTGKTYLIWGYGNWGRKLFRLLKSMRISVDAIVDSKGEGAFENVEECKVFAPTEDFIKKSEYIILAYKGDKSRTRDVLRRLEIEENHVLDIDDLMDLCAQKMRGKGFEVDMNRVLDVVG